MESIAGHPHALRLLKVTVAALVLSWAFADAARADLGVLGPSSAPLAPASSTVSGISSTLDATLGTATTSTGDALGAVQATVGQTEGSLGETAETTLGSASTTVEQIAGTASATLGETPDQSLVATTTTLQETLGRTAEVVVPSTVDRATAEPSPLEATSGSVGSEPAHPAPTGSSKPVSPGFASPRAVPDSPPLLADLAGPSRARMTHQAQRRVSVATDVPPALVGAASPPPARGAPSSPRPQRPDQPLPNDPAGPLEVLLQGSSGTGMLVLGVLLGLLSLSLSRDLGARLRLAVDPAHPPDVFFRLERPG